jgi:hypothetical protein
VQIDNVVFDLVANVRKKAEGNYVYSIQLNENKKIEIPPTELTVWSNPQLMRVIL